MCHVMIITKAPYKLRFCQIDMRFNEFMNEFFMFLLLYFFVDQISMGRKIFNFFMLLLYCIDLGVFSISSKYTLNLATVRFSFPRNKINCSKRNTYTNKLFINTIYPNITHWIDKLEYWPMKPISCKQLQPVSSHAISMVFSFK